MSPPEHISWHRGSPRIKRIQDGLSRSTFKINNSFFVPVNFLRDTGTWYTYVVTNIPYIIIAEEPSNNTAMKCHGGTV